MRIFLGEGGGDRHKSTRALTNTLVLPPPPPVPTHARVSKPPNIMKPGPSPPSPLTDGSV